MTMRMVRIARPSGGIGYEPLVRPVRNGLSVIRYRVPTCDGKARYSVTHARSGWCVGAYRTKRAAIAARAQLVGVIGWNERTADELLADKALGLRVRAILTATGAVGYERAEQRDARHDAFADSTPGDGR